MFLDQSGELGGAELCLLDVAKPYRDHSVVALLADGPFRAALEQHQIPVQVLTARSLQIRKQSGLWQGLSSLRQLLPLAVRVSQLSQGFDLIYANTQKALVVGALASGLGRRPLVYHLHDILSEEHFSSVNRRLAVLLANQFAAQVITNSEATRSAFVAAGGQSRLTSVIYNGFDPATYQAADRDVVRRSLGLTGFVVGQFSRLSPWKGQHVLLEALTNCSADVTALFVGSALFGEQEYAQQLQAQVTALGLQDRVRFLGFRSDVIPLMHACDLVAHTSTAPEPFGRVIVEAMLCGRPVVASAAGGAIELVESGSTGWLVPPNDPQALAAAIREAQAQPDTASAIGDRAQQQASQRFDLLTIQRQIAEQLQQVSQGKPVGNPAPCRDPP
nr:glycosyltransferase family 4 protein [Leptolyngbya sp. FACHB-36]